MGIFTALAGVFNVSRSLYGMTKAWNDKFDSCEQITEWARGESGVGKPVPQVPCPRRRWRYASPPPRTILPRCVFSSARTTDSLPHGLCLVLWRATPTQAALLPVVAT